MSREDRQEEASAIVNYFSAERKRRAKEKANAPISSGQLFDLIDEVRKAGLTVEQAQILKDTGLFNALLCAAKNDPDWLRRPEIMSEVSHPLGLDRYWIDMESNERWVETGAEHPKSVQGKILWNPEEFDVVLWTQSVETKGFFDWRKEIDPPGILWSVTLLRFFVQHPELLPECHREKKICFWSPVVRNSCECGYAMYSANFFAGRVHVGEDDFLSMLMQPHWVAVRKEIASPVASAT